MEYFNVVGTVTMRNLGKVIVKVKQTDFASYIFFLKIIRNNMFIFSYFVFLFF